MHNNSNRMDKDPFFAVIKCEMCINPVTNFVAGLCSRCEKMWANHGMESTIPSINSIRAAVVASVRSPDGPMDPTFHTAMMNARLKKSQKIALFQKIRGQFASGVLTPDSTSQMAVPFKTEDNYWDIPEIMDEDVLAFQRNVDLLADMVPDRSRSLPDKDKDNEDSGLPK